MIDKTKHIRPGMQIKLILCPMQRRLGSDISISPGKIYKIIKTPSSRSRRNGNMGVWIQGQYRPLFIWMFEYTPIIQALKRTKEIKKSFSIKRTK